MSVIPSNDTVTYKGSDSSTREAVGVVVLAGGSGGGGGGGGAVTVADGADVAEGATTAAAYADTTGATASTVVGLLKGLYVALRTATQRVGGVYRTAPTALVDGDRPELLTDDRGNLRARLTLAQWTAADGVNKAAAGRYDRFDQPGSALIPAGIGLVDNGTTLDLVKGDTNGSYSVSKGSGGLVTAQVSVGTTATQIVAARAKRGSVKITNLGTVDIFVGVAGVTATTGDLLPGTKGASITIPANVAVFGVAATAQTVSVMEVF